MTVPMLMPNAAAAAVSMHLDARAFARTVVSACASSTESIANAYEHLQARSRRRHHRGRHRVVHPPASRSPSFASMQALSQAQRRPGHGIPALRRRPRRLRHGRGRRGARARDRGARPGARREDLRRDRRRRRHRATRTTSPLPTPRARAPRARCAPRSSRPARAVDDVTHINAHATSTPVGDIAEYKALLAVFGDRVHEIPVSATKAATGHLLGGTGALEAIFTILAVARPQAPPTINLDRARTPRSRCVVTVAADARRRAAARDQQLVRLRRPQRRRRDRVRR